MLKVSFPLLLPLPLHLCLLQMLTSLEGTALFIRAIGKSDTERKRIGKKAERCFQLALSVNSADYMTLCNYGFLYHSIFQVGATIKEEEGEEESCWLLTTFCLIETLRMCTGQGSCTRKP